MATIEKRIIDSLEAFGLKFNAAKIYDEFLQCVENNDFREDGTCRLFNILDNYIINTQKVNNNIRKGKHLFRARIIRDDHLSKEYGVDITSSGKMIGFDEGNSREAPLGLPPAGRNNIPGVSYLYLADRMETACAEVKPNTGQLISVAEFVTTKKMQIVDFSRNYTFERQESREQNAALGLLFTDIMTQYFSPVSDNSEYKVSQVITDHIRKTGVDGISYKSLYDSQGINFTFFNSSRDRFKFFGSRIVMLQSERRTILDFNENRVKEANTLGFATYNEDFSEKIKNRIGERILKK